ncbi:MAG: cupin domain-containing protein [Planctomycetes bacterium]|nr:cupin domain-containing protein [Planctomycetota bacterium]
MFHINWTDVRPWLEYKSTAWVRFLLRRPNSPWARQGTPNLLTNYFEWVKAITVTPGKTLQRHAHNVAEVWYVQDGWGEVEIGGKTKHVGPRNLIAIPPEVPHSLTNTTNTTAITVVSWAVANPPDNTDLWLEEVAPGEGKTVDEPLVSQWTDRNDEISGHMDTVWWYGMFGRQHQEGWPCFHGVGMMIVPAGAPNDLHLHNYEIFYYIDRGEGTMRVADETCSVRACSMGYVPANTPHSVMSRFPDMQINVLCVMVRVPHDAPKVNIHSVAEGGKFLNR